MLRISDASLSALLCDSEALAEVDSLSDLDSALLAETDSDWLYASDSFFEASSLLIVLLEIAVDRLSESISLKRFDARSESDAYCEAISDFFSLKDLLSDSKIDLLCSWLKDLLCDLLNDSLSDLLFASLTEILREVLCDSFWLSEVLFETLIEALCDSEVETLADLDADRDLLVDSEADALKDADVDSLADFRLSDLLLDSELLLLSESETLLLMLSLVL